MLKRSVLFLVFGALFAAVVAAAAAAAEVPRTTKEELKAKLDAGEEVLVVDVRRGADWKGSESKIKGATRATDVEAFAAGQRKDAVIVFYCA